MLPDKSTFIFLGIDIDFFRFFVFLLKIYIVKNFISALGWIYEEIYKNKKTDDNLIGNLNKKRKKKYIFAHTKQNGFNDRNHKTQNKYKIILLRDWIIRK